MILIILLGLAAFGRVARFEFTSWDDDDTVAHNPLLNPPTAASMMTIWSRPQMKLFIPVTYTAWFLAANTSQPQPPPGTIAPPTGTPFVPDARVFHTLNLAIHLLCAWLVFLILRELVRSDLPALAGALVFLLHPVQVEPVAWVSGMKDVLFAAFSLIAIWQYIRLVREEQDHEDHEDRGADPPIPPRQWWQRYLLATLAFVLAMLSKPTAMVVPAIVIAIDLLLLRSPWRAVLARAWPWVVLAIPCAVATRLVQPISDANVAPWFIPLAKRPLVAADALGFYLFKLVWPATLTFDYGRTPQRVVEKGWSGLTWLVPLFAMIVLLALRNRARTLLAAAMISFIVLLPVLGLVPFEFQGYSTVADHYLYLAMLGPALALAWILSKRVNGLTLSIAGIVLLALAARSFEQTPYWRTSSDLFEHGRQSNPSSYASYNSLAELALDARDYPSAVQLASAALQLNPKFFPAYMTRGGALAQAGDVDGAIADIHHALDLAPNQPHALGNLAALLGTKGRYADAIPYARRAVDAEPDSLSSRLNLAALYVAVGDEPNARPQLQWVLNHNPDNAAARTLLSQLHPPPAASPTTSP